MLRTFWILKQLVYNLLNDVNYGAVAIGRVECRVSEHVFLITNMLIPQYNCNVGVTTIAICVGIMDAPWPLLSLRFVLELRCYVSP